MFEKKGKPEYVECEDCIKYRKTLGYESVPRGYHMGRDSTGEVKLIPCQCFIKYQRALRLFYLLKNAGFDTTYTQTYHGSDYIGTQSVANIGRLRKYINNFEKVKDCVLYFYGGNSTQKTTVASWVGKKLLLKGYTVKFILMNDLIKKLTAFTTEEQLASDLDKYKSCDLLIVDEAFDKSKVTIYKSGYQIPFVDSFLRERISLGKGILFVSNVAYSDIASEGFSPSLQALISRNVVSMDSCFVWKDNFLETSAGFDKRKGLF